MSALQLPNPDGEALMANLIMNQAEGWVSVREEAIPGLYYNDCSPEDVAAILPRLQVEPFMPYKQPVSHAGLPADVACRHALRPGL